MALVTKTFSEIITFTRASNATYFNSSGLLTNTSFNALTYSNNLENAAWTKTAATVTANVTTGPFGVVDAERLMEDTATSGHQISQATASSVATQQVFSIYAKADTRSVLSLTMNNTGGNAQFSNFDLTAGTATGSPTTSLGWTGATASIVSVGNGWYRCILTANSAGTAGITATASIVVGGSTNYTGNGTSGLFLYGAQLQTGVISAYIPTTTVANSLPRLDYNPATLAAQGLLIEEQRVNLVLYSANFDNAVWGKAFTTITPNAIVSPDGNVNAPKLVETTATNEHYVRQLFVGLTASANYTTSIYIKAGERTAGQVRILDTDVPNNGYYVNFNLATATVIGSGVSAGTFVSASIANAGNGWYRIAVTGSITGTKYTFDTFIHNPAGTQNYTGDGVSGLYLYGAQLEAGSFATSYAPSVNTFTSRSTTGSYFDSAGVLQSAAINVARNTYNPANLAAQPFLLLEEARTNFFTNASGASGGSIGTGTVLGPDNVLCRTFIPTAGVQSFPSVSGPNQTFSAGLGATVDWALSGWLAEGPAGTPTLEPRLIFNVSVNGTTSFIYAELQINTSTWTVRSKTLGAGLSEISAPSITLFKTGLYRVTWVVRYTQDATARNSISAAIQARNTAGSGTYTADGVSGVQYALVQAETGSFVTSTIPTTTAALPRAADLSSSAQATRAADVASVNTLSPWFNATEGTLYAEYNIPYALTTGSGPRLFALNGVGGPAIDEMPLFTNQAAGKAASFNSFTASVNAGRIDATPAFVANTVIKAAAGYATNNRAVTANGAAPTTSSTVYTIPTITIARLGTQDSFGNNAINGYLRRISYYPRRLSDAELQSLTT